MAVPYRVLESKCTVQETYMLIMAWLAAPAAAAALKKRWLGCTALTREPELHSLLISAQDVGIISLITRISRV